MKNTPLTETHIALGAKMAEFAGYNMPISYKGIKEEHHQVRNSVGMFDVSHMGEFILEGEKALDLIQKVTSNDASKLIDGQAQYSCLPNDKGGIVDDLLVYKIADHKYMLVVNASNIDKDWNWISAHNEFGVKMTNISDATSLLAVQGPKATATLQKLTSVNLAEISYYHFSQGDFAGCKDVILSATGYTGAGGFELYVPNESAATVWNKIIEAGAEFGIQPIGLGARDTLRLEMGFCLYGNDINDTTNPIEAGLGWITKFTKSFVGDQFAKDLKENGSKRKLVGIQMIDRGIPRHDYEVIDASGNKIGIVTSGSQTPSLDVSIGLAYIDIPHNKLDTEIYIKIRENSIKAKVVKMPFYQKTN
jgi:aminomethyltransferase